MGFSVTKPKLCTAFPVSNISNFSPRTKFCFEKEKICQDHEGHEIEHELNKIVLKRHRRMSSKYFCLNRFQPVKFIKPDFVPFARKQLNKLKTLPTMGTSLLARQMPANYSVHTMSHELNFLLFLSLLFLEIRSFGTSYSSFHFLKGYTLFLCVITGQFYGVSSLHRLPNYFINWSER